MYKQDLALNNLRWLAWHKTQPNQTKSIHVMFDVFVELNTLVMCKIS